MYIRQKAVEYASKWWNGRNPNFYDFDLMGGDCTNFVSQCLYHGGIQMLKSPLGWFYESLNYRSPSWAGEEEFFSFCTTNNNALGVKAKVVQAYEVEVGDVVQICLWGEDRFHHTLLITKTNFQNFSDPNNPNQNFQILSNIFVSGHTINVFNKPLTAYNFKDVRFLKILNT